MSYNSSDKLNATLVFLQFVLLEGVFDVLHRTLGMENKDDPVILIYMKLQLIHTFFCLKVFYDNPLVINEQDQITPTLGEVKKNAGSAEG